MAVVKLVENVKDFLYNVIDQTKNTVNDLPNRDEVLSEISNSSLVGNIFQSRAEQTFLSDYTNYGGNIPSYPLSKCKVFFNWFDTTHFLNTYNSSTIYAGEPSSGTVYSKEEFLNNYKNSNLLCYLGTGPSTGDLTSAVEDGIFSVFHRDEPEDPYDSLTGVRFYTLNNGIGNAYYVGCPHPIGGFFAISLAKPLFYGSVSYGNINHALSINKNLNNLNFYNAMIKDNTNLNIETTFYIVDDLNPELFHIFRIYNKNIVFNMFKLWGFNIYYKSVSDLENTLNPYSFDDLDPVEPSTDTEPNTTTNPGQSQNTVQNQQTGTGDWSSDDVTTPESPYTGTGIGNCLYTINLKQMYKVRNELFKPDVISSFFIDGESLLGCTIWPFKYSGNGLYTVTDVVIGKYHVQLLGQSEVTPYAYAILPTYIPKIYVAQGISIQPKNGSFLDYAPYTKIKFYMPYIGIVDVDPCDIYDHTIDIYYLYEPSTGKGKGCIKSSSGVIYSWDCMLGTTVPFTISNMNQLLQNLALSGIKTIGAVATGGITGAALATDVISSIAGSVRDFKISSTGSTGDSMGRLEPQEVYCITIGPYTRIPDDYNKNYGRPSLITVQLNKLKGFTTVPNPLFTTTATDTEKAEIESLLKEGVIING